MTHFAALLIFLGGFLAGVVTLFAVGFARIARTTPAGRHRPSQPRKVLTPSGIEEQP